MDVRQLTLPVSQPSATALPREQFLGMPKRGLAFLLANVMFWQPIWAQADGIAVSGPGTSLDHAGNGVPIVNIAAPNASGLSHNQFQDYNVGVNGVILNNATLREQSTQLGGLILGNPNLHGTAAQIILNEVNGGRPSQLNGYTEVAGQSARVIVANPYGISCNGCGFINTPRVTLTTGKPVLNGAGGLDHYQVDGGSVSIDGVGMNANNVDSFEIITRSAKINAKLQANNLSIITGRNDVNAQTLNATARADDGSAKPQLAIDSSALGGMYAGAIKLVGTEAGVGVRLAGNLAASAGDIQISANGQLSLAQTAATGAINVNAASLETQGPVYAGTSLNVQTQGDLTNQQSLAARDSINLSAGGQLTNNGIIEAGVNADNSRNSTGDVNVAAQTLTNNGHSVIASRHLSVSGTTLNNVAGTLRSQQNLTVQLSGGLNNTQGLLSSEALLSVSAASLANRLGSLSSAGQLSIGSSGWIDNQGGQLVTDAGLNLYSTSLDNSQGGSISGKGAVSVSTGAFNNNAGSLSSGSNLSLNAGPVTNQNGRIASAGALSASVTGLDQQGGKLFSTTSLTLDLNHGQLNNSNGLITAPILVLNNLNGVVNQGGEISSAQAFTLAANSVDNSNGHLLSNQTLTLRINQALTNLKGQIAAAALDVQAGSLDNSGGTLTSQDALNLKVDGLLSNQNLGRITATGLLNISSAGLNNQNGTLFGSAIAVDFGTGTGDLNNQGGFITTDGQLSIAHLRDLNNQGGEISSAQSFTLAGRTLDNSAGDLISNGQLTVDADTLINQNGLVSGWYGLKVNAGSLDNRNTGTLSSRYGDVTVDVTGALLNSANGALVSQKALTVNAASLDNRGGILSSGTDQTLSVSGGLDNGQNGLIDSGGALTLNTMALTNVGGVINAQQALIVNGSSLDNSSGTLAGNGAVTLTLLSSLTNAQGKLASAGPLWIQTSQINNQGGQIVSQGLLTLLTGGLDNSHAGTLAASGPLVLTASGAVLNNDDGLIYSQAADVQLRAASLNNASGTVQSQGALALTLSGDLDNRMGRLIAQNHDLVLSAGMLDNRGGVLSSLTGAVTAWLSGWLNNGQGGMVQGQSLDLTAQGGIDNTAGRLAAQTGDAVIHTSNLNNTNGGLYATGGINLTGSNLDNNNGQIAGDQIDLALSGALSNRLGIVESGSTLNVAAASVDNQSGKLRALGTSGQTRFQIGGLFDNQNGTLESANTDLILATGNFLNANGTLLHVGTGTFDIDSRQALAAGGSLVTRGALSLSGNGLSNSSVIQAGRLSLNLTNFNQTASGQLLASDSLVGSGSNWNNDGLIASDGSINLTLGGAYAGNGRLSASGDLTLNSDQVSLSSSASIVGGGTTRLNVAGALTNYGRLTSSGDLIVNAGSVSNYGTLGSSQNLYLNTPTLLNEHGLIFAGGDLVLGVNTFTNHLADVYGLGNVRIGGYGGAARAASVYNIAGNLESVGDFSLKAAVFENRTDGATNSAGRKLTSGFIANICNDCQGDDWIVTLAAHELFESDDSDTSAAATLSAGRNFDFEGGTFLNSKSTVSAGGDITIVADSLQNIGSVAGTIERIRTYEISLKDNAMNDFLANVMTPYNQRNNPDFPLVSYIDGTGAIRKAIASSYLGREPGHDGGAYYFVKLTDTETGLVINDRYGWGFPLSGLSYGFEGNITSQYDPNNLVALPSQLTSLAPITDIEIATDSTGGASTGTIRNAVIQAGGKVNITARQDLINSVIHEDYAFSGSSSKVEDTQIGEGPRVQVRINAQLPADLAQQQVNPTTLPGFSLPTGQNGLFRLSGQDSSTGSTGPQSWTLGGASLLTGQHQNAGTSVARVQGVPTTSGGSHPQKYLIETNPALTDLKQFMSSDYLLGKLGYDPDDSARRLGDGLYEQRLIQQAIVARTGQRFIEGMTSDEAQFRYLMDNAIASKDALSLSVGIGLTAEQIAALTHDIVWLESEVIDGQTVLVPVLYLANANNRLAPNGALIQGSDVTLIAGNDLNNSGTLKATGNLSAAAGNNLVNSGLVNAGGRLDLLAGNDLTNKAGGIIAGRDVSLGAIGGDIINERTVTSYQNSGNGFSLQRDFVDNAARIEAANDLTVSAGRDVNNVGGVLQSGRDLSIGAGRDVNITTAAQIASNDRGVNLNDSSIKHYGAEVTAGQDLSIQAGRDLIVIGSQLNAGGNAALDAGNDLTIASSADEEHRYSKTKSVTEQEDHVHQNGSGVKAGGDVTLKAGNDLTLISSDVEAGGEAYLSAGNKLALLAAQDSDYSLYDMKKKGSFGSEKTQHDEVTDIKNIGSLIKSGGNLTLVSGGDQRYQGARLESGKDITLDSGGSITFEAVKDVHQESHTKSDNDAFWVSSEGKGSTDETLRQTQMVAGGSVTIKAVEGLHIDLNQINQNTVTQSIDAMVKADPQLAWLKDAEARGDVDWQLVQEIHDSFKYDTSGLGPASQLIIAIVMAAIVGPAALGALGTAGASAAWAAAGAAVATAAATNATVSFINNGGDIGAVFKDVTSRDALKGYVIAGVTAGFTAEYFSEWTDTKWDPNTGKITTDLGSLKGIGQFAANQGLQNASATALSKILGQGGDLGDALRTTLLNTLAAASFNAVGDYSQNLFADGSLGKIAIHAMVGGLLAKIAGGDFATGALAAGANEALVVQLNALVQGNPNLLLMSSQIVGVLAAATQHDVTADSLQNGAWVANNATQYNYLNHDQLAQAAKELRACNDAACREELVARYKDLSFAQDLEAAAACSASPASCAAYSKEVANTMANLDDIYQILGDGPSHEWESLRQSNLGFQDMLATFTAGHTSASIAEAMQQKWGLSDEETRVVAENLVLVAAGGFAAIAAKKALAALKTKSDATVKNAVGASGDLASSKVKWVDENAGMSSRARDYNDSATGARSNPATQSGQAPALERTMPDGSTRLVKFDGVDGDVLVDRKISVVTTSKSKDQALRQSDVLSQNGLTARWEVPTQAQAARAQKMFDELGIKNISVKVIHEPGNQ